MKIFIFLMSFFGILYAKEHFAKVEPIDILTIASEVSGKVVFVDEDKLGKKLSKKPYIKIDSYLDTLNLKITNQKLINLKALQKADKEMIINLQKTLQRKEQNYKRIKDLRVKSKTQKDLVFYDIIATKNQILSIQKELSNLSSQIQDLTLKKAQLQKSLSDKKIQNPSYVLYELFVKKGDYVTPSKPLAKVADISKAILKIYIDAEELEKIEDKKVYLNGKETSYKISRVIPIADSTNLSKYRVEIIINPPKIFSKLVKVELK